VNIGARIGEVLALQWCDVDSDKAQVLSRCIMSIGGQVVGPKSGSSVRKVVSSEPLKRLQILYREQREHWFRESRETPAWEFCKHTERAAVYATWRKAFVWL